MSKSTYSGSPQPSPDGPDVPQVRTNLILIDTNKLKRFGLKDAKFEQGVLCLAVECDPSGKGLYQLDIDPSSGLTDRQIDDLRERVERTILLSALA